METLAVIFLIIQSLAVFSNVFGIPGGIAAAILAVIMFFMNVITMKFMIAVLFVFAAGEFVEFYASYVVGKRYGVSGKGFWASVIGALILGIVLSPMFLGLGAIIGTFVGAYAGALGYELMIGTTPVRAREKAKGVLFGRCLGTFSKMGAGFFAIYLEVNHIFG